jgi:CheY-like chemotaxis protein
VAWRVAPTRRILVIDDEADVRRTVRRMLVAHGYEVEEAADGDTGIARYRERPADVVLTDILMPGKEGLETVRDLRTMDPEARIIVMSGAGAGPGGYLNVALRFGAQRVLLKPFSMSELITAVNEVLA